jgi:hypothetical protein
LKLNNKELVLGLVSISIFFELDNSFTSDYSALIETSLFVSDSLSLVTGFFFL